MKDVAEYEHLLPNRDVTGSRMTTSSMKDFLPCLLVWRCPYIHRKYFHKSENVPADQNALINVHQSHHVRCTDRPVMRTLKPNDTGKMTTINFYCARFFFKMHSRQYISDIASHDKRDATHNLLRLLKCDLLLRTFVQECFISKPADHALCTVSVKFVNQISKSR